MNLSDLVMDREQLLKYILDRQFDKDHFAEQLANVERIVKHIARRESEAEALLRSAGVRVQKYYPLESSEAHFYTVDNLFRTLHVVNPRCVTREKRDLEQFQVLPQLLGREIPIEFDYYGNDRAKAHDRFRQFSFELVEEMFQHLDIEAVRAKGNITIFMGPHKSLPISEDEVKANVPDDFLNMVISTDNIVFLDYPFGVQARDVLDQFYLYCNAYFSNLGVRVVHYGKAGVVNKKRKVGDVFVPQSAFDGIELLAGDKREYRIDNKLASDKRLYQQFSQILGEKVHRAVTINTTSALIQTKQEIEVYRREGADIIDMECLLMTSDQGYRTRYPWLGKIEYFIAVVGSDKPPESTLANTVYPVEKEEAVTKALLDIVRNNL